MLSQLCNKQQLSAASNLGDSSWLEKLHLEMLVIEMLNSAPMSWSFVSTLRNVWFLLLSQYNDDSIVTLQHFATPFLCFSLTYGSLQGNYWCINSYT